LRIVLFGMPHAGKSSLLGALAQATQTQEYLLNGHLTDLGGGLAELHHRLYDERPQETLEEVVPYAVTYEPLAAHTERTEAVLVDCDGRVANELITRRRALTAGNEAGDLAQAILQADTLVLVIDASATPSQVDADFMEFSRFLRLLEQSRGRRSDVGGLPVLLVLAKCDLLAAPTDTPAAWMERIEERKRQVDARFQTFLSRQKTEGLLNFGRLDLHIWATAVKRPPLAGVPAMPREPYGVAELFRQSFALARAFRQRRGRSGRRLAWTVGAGAGMVAAMTALAAGLLLYRPQEDPGIQELTTKVESYRAREAQTPSSRLRGPLQRKISELTELKMDPHFSRLPSEKQDYLESRLQELQDYRAYEEKLQAASHLEQFRSARELEAAENTLASLVPPAEHQADWSQTDAVLFRARLLADVRAVRKAVAETENWFNTLLRRGQELWTFTGKSPGAPIPWIEWNKEVQTLFAQADAHFLPADNLAQSSITLINSIVLQVDRVTAARDNWQTIRKNLERVRDLSGALGLSAATPGRSPLHIPAGFQAEQAIGRLQELEKLYPRYQQEFHLADLPEVIVPEIRQTARTGYDNALKAGQEVVLRHFKEVSPGRESLDSWRRLGPWLASPEDLRAWRVLATTLARLQDPAGEDPVSALDAFLRRERFDLSLKRVAVEIPDDAKIRPEGRFLLHHFSGGEKRAPIVFQTTGEERHDARRRMTRYEFQPVGDGRLTYKPEDILWGDLPVQNGGSPGWVLTWARNRSQVYQFERLLRPPRLHPKDKENTQGEVQDGISLEITPESGVPKMPDLMPVVPLAREVRSP
jgi:hypothetical protein